MKNNTHGSKKISRRTFTKSVAATLVTAPLASSLSRAQNKNTARPEAVAPPNPKPSPTPQTPSPIAEAYAGVARARFGNAVTPEQLNAIKKDIEGNVRTTERLRSVKLQNGDEPDFVFTA